MNYAINYLLVLGVAALCASCHSLKEPAPYVVATPELMVTFMGPEFGFSCRGLENRLAGEEFGAFNPTTTGLWELEFRSYGEDRSQPPEICRLRNNDCRDARCMRLPNGLRFEFRDLDLPGEKAAVDVLCTVTANADQAIEWRIHVDNRSTRFGLWETVYPYLQTVVKPGEADVLLPKDNFGGKLVKNCRESYKVIYPSAHSPVQLMAFLKGTAGLYIGVHDGDAWMKQLALAPQQHFFVQTRAENAGVAGAAGAPRFPVVTQAFQGNWVKAAKIYRKWALKQFWCEKGPLATRKDFSPLMLKPGYWTTVTYDAGPVKFYLNHLRSKLKELGAEELCAKYHWYSWHNERFDTHYPDGLTPRPGVADTMAAAVAQGDVMMPYINGRLFDQNLPHWPTIGRANSCTTPDGSPYTETVQNGTINGVVCPSTPQIQEVYYNFVKKLKDELGINAIYLDQIASAWPVPCFNPQHGHPLGGGGFWVKGHRELLGMIRSLGLMMTTENTAEPYLAEVDAFLAWLERRPTDVPLLEAIYSGYTIYFTSQSDYQDTQEAFQAIQSRDLLWGTQLGWMDPRLFTAPENAEKFKYLVGLTRLHFQLGEFFQTGELLDEPVVTPQENTVTFVWNRNNVGESTLPAIQSTVWSNFNHNRLLIALANHSGTVQQADLSFFKLQDFLPECENATRDWQVLLHTVDGRTPLCRLVNGRFDAPLQLAPYEIALLIIQPDVAEPPDATPANPRLANATDEWRFRENSDVRIALAPLSRCLTGRQPEAHFCLNGNGSIEITLPDGQKHLVTVAGQPTELSLPFAWNAETQSANLMATVSLPRTGNAYLLPFTVRHCAPIELILPKQPHIAGQDCFCYPIAIVNNTDETLAGRPTLTMPDGWRASGLEEVAIAPGKTLTLKALELIAPDLHEATTASFAFSLAGYSAAFALPVAPSRPELVMPRRTREITLDGDLREWADVPAITAGNTPETTRIQTEYQGDNVALAHLMLQYDDEYLYVAVDALDDVHYNVQDVGTTIWNGDCLQVTIHPGRHPNPYFGFDETEIQLAFAYNQLSGKKTCFLWYGFDMGRALETASLCVKRDDQAQTTRYEARVPLGEIGLSIPQLRAEGATFSFTLNDHDGKGFRGWVEWTPGLCGRQNSSAFGRLCLAE